MDTTVRVPCPYCGNVAEYLVRARTGGELQLVYCDTEESHGCGKPFAVDVKVEVTTKVFGFWEAG